MIKRLTSLPNIDIRLYFATYLIKHLLFWILIKHTVTTELIYYLISVCGSRYHRPSDFRITSICKFCKTVETQRGLIKEEKTHSLEQMIKFKFNFKTLF